MDPTSGMDIIARAVAVEQSHDGLIHDYAARLFPQSGTVLSDRLLSNSRLALHNLIANLEREICLIAVRNTEIANEALIKIANGTHNGSFKLMERAGILRDQDVLDPVFAHAQKRELQTRLLQQFSQSDLEAALTRNLDHEDPAIADAAMGLLVALNRHSGGEMHHSELSAESLYDLIWKVVAALEQISGTKGGKLHSAAEQFLRDHDESESVQNSALRLANLLDQNEAGANEPPHPLQDGLELCLARLSVRSGISIAHLVRMTAEPHLSRLVIVLRSFDLPVDAALSIYASIDGSGGMLTAATYNEIAIESAQELVQGWTMNTAYRSAQTRLRGDPEYR